MAVEKVDNHHLVAVFDSMVAVRDDEALKQIENDTEAVCDSPTLNICNYSFLCRPPTIRCCD
jgi:hypothetical protein